MRNLNILNFKYILAQGQNIL